MYVCTHDLQGKMSDLKRVNMDPRQEIVSLKQDKNKWREKTFNLNIEKKANGLMKHF